tara:strand:- start:404 stop:805 length:402 start_codon:yes stop_codon:yes gene_type:complete
MNLYDYRWTIFSIIQDFKNYNASYTYSLQVKANNWINKNIDINERIAILHRELYGLNTEIIRNNLNGKERWDLSKFKFKDVEIIKLLKSMNIRYFTIMNNFNYLFTPEAFENFEYSLKLIFKNESIKIYEIKE